MTPKTTSEHEAQLLGLLLMDNRSLMENLRFGLKLTRHDFASLGNAWENLVDLHQQGEPLTPATYALLDPQSDTGAWVDAAFAINDEEARTFAKGMIQQADRRAQKSALQRAQVELESGKDSIEVQRDLSLAFAAKRGTVLQDTSFGAIRKRIDEKVARGEKTWITPTRIPWFDYLLRGGLRSKRFIAVGGAQKGRKTSLLRNLLKGATSDKHGNPNTAISVAFLCYENDQEISYYDMVAMYAYEYLMAQGKHQLVIASNPVVMSGEQMDGEIIQTAYENGKLSTWRDASQEAVRWAMETVDLLPINVYDSQPENGNLHDLESLKQVMEMHRQVVLQPNQHYVIAVDYAQLVEHIGKDYEDMKALSKTLLWACQHYDATVIALSQLNEAANYAKAAAGGKKTVDHVGTKGGGSLEAAVHNYYTTSYNRDRPDYLTVEQSRARRSPSKRKEFEVHPPSGLIIR